MKVDENNKLSWISPVNDPSFHRANTSSMPPLILGGMAELYPLTIVSYMQKNPYSIIKMEGDDFRRYSRYRRDNVVHYFINRLGLHHGLLNSYRVSRSVRCNGDIGVSGLEIFEGGLWHTTRTRDLPVRIRYTPSVVICIKRSDLHCVEGDGIYKEINKKHVTCYITKEFTMPNGYDQGVRAAFNKGIYPFLVEHNINIVRVFAEEMTHKLSHVPSSRDYYQNPDLNMNLLEYARSNHSNTKVH